MTVKSCTMYLGIEASKHLECFGEGLGNLGAALDTGTTPHTTPMAPIFESMNDGRQWSVPKEFGSELSLLKVSFLLYLRKK